MIKEADMCCDSQGMLLSAILLRKSIGKNIIKVNKQTDCRLVMVEILHEPLYTKSRCIYAFITIFI